MKLSFYSLIVFILLTCELYAKNPISLNFKVGPSINNISNYNKYSIGLMGSLSGDFQIARRSSISLGFGLNQFNDKYSGHTDTTLNPFPGPTSICSCNYYKTDLTFVQFLVPIKYNYSIIKNELNQFFVSAGLEISSAIKFYGSSTSFRIDSDGSIEYEHPSSKYDNKSHFNESLNNVFRRMIGIGYTRSITSDFSVSIESNYTKSEDLKLFEMLLGIRIEL